MIIVRNGVWHVIDHKLDTSETHSQCPSGDPALQVQSSKVQSQITDLQFLVEWLLRELKMDPFWTTVFILFEEKSVF